MNESLPPSDHRARRQRPRLARLGNVFQDARVVSDRAAADADNELPAMSAATGHFELHTSFPIPSNKRDQIIAGFANFSKDGTPAKTLGKQLEEIAAIEPTSPVGQLLGLRAKTAGSGQPAAPNTFDGWSIALRFQNIGIDTTDENDDPLGDDVYHRHYTAGTELVVDVTLRVPLGTGVSTWGALRDAIESDNPTTFAGAKADLIDIVQTEGLGLEAENLIDALTLA
ncbi:MAG: hypothetical protein JSR82_02195 [Verrucomicrobia bacterium]|nr:hypothetical protein [Verrucomicrobiota bacterium]